MINDFDEREKQKNFPIWLLLPEKIIFIFYSSNLISFLDYKLVLSYNIFIYQMIEIPDDPSAVQPIFQELKRNFKTGATRSATFRKNAMDALIRGYQDLKDQINEAQKQDLGMSHFISELATHATTVNEIKDLRANFQGWMKPRHVPTPVAVGWASSSIQYEPLGVVLVISAWNYPIYTSIPQVAAGIVAGNCVILKPSEVAPHTSKVLKKLFEKYMDQRYFRCIEGKVEVAKATTKLPLDLICFTGSTFTGRLVAIEAAKNLTPCLLELGGKCPIIVDETAKIESAVLRILFGKFVNCGQTCVGVDHVYIHESVYKAFRKLLLQKIDEMFGNQDLQQNPQYGRIINSLRVNRLQELMKDKHEGEVIYGGQIEKDKKFISPTIVEAPKKDSLMMQEEIFGPIMPIYSYTNLDSVIEEIIDRPKPLVVYIFSENKANIKKVKNKTYSGTFVVNDTILQLANNHLPFGGVGMSGSGRYHGESGFINFSNAKSICEIAAFNPYPLSCRFPPYTDKSKKTMLGLLGSAGLTYSQIGRYLLILLLLVVIGLVVGLVVVPNVS